MRRVRERVVQMLQPKARPTGFVTSNEVATLGAISAGRTLPPDEFRKLQFGQLRRHQHVRLFRAAGVELLLLAPRCGRDRRGKSRHKPSRARPSRPSKLSSASPSSSARTAPSAKRFEPPHSKEAGRLGRKLQTLALHDGASPKIGPSRAGEKAPQNHLDPLGGSTMKRLLAAGICLAA